MITATCTSVFILCIKLPCNAPVLEVAQKSPLNVIFTQPLVPDTCTNPLLTNFTAEYIW